MPVVRVVSADPKLPHQIVITVKGAGGGIEVTCVCRKKRRQSAFGLIGQKTAWELYQAGPHITTDGAFNQLVTGKRMAYVI